ncbi:DUF3592 domain-containing protein [Hydrogenophaga sp. A37]|uniref:DUF3592 domain-containing protein n=1 Tax=Hydrogenophaga sp. A37 TaxID=1945864 RepID=UPI000986D7F4|nr:DUF3592 domain-containing protein [Hydrogenophaga sp. A37]OOG83397.1 hypothetical protein B0E41_12770 [Hydrogenophaga sp. A37]
MNTTTSTSTVRRFFGLLGWILLVPSALTALGSAWLLASSLNFSGEMQTAQGRVVGHHDSFVGTSTRRGFAQQSIVEFVASDGRTLRFTDSVLRQLQAVHEVGETVTVRYPVNDPSSAEIGSSGVLKVFIGSILLLFSGVGMAIGWLLLRLRPKPASATSVA